MNPTQIPAPSLNPDKVNSAVPQEREYEIIVVGSGPGASFAACMLAEAGHEVLLLEEGLFWPFGNPSNYSREELQYKYRNGGITVAFGRPRVQYVEGLCLGGGSEVNSGLYHRLPDDIRADWFVRCGLDDMSTQVMNAHAEAVEKEISVSLFPGEPKPPAKRLKEAAESIGWKAVETPRWHSYAPGDLKGQRQTMTRTCLPRSVAAGALLVTDAKVVFLIRKGRIWEITTECGRLKGNRRTLTLRARHIFLGAGAVGTPALLRRSRLGRRAGDFLHLHPTIKVIAEFDDPVNSPDLGVPMHQIREFGNNITFGGSISTPHYMTVSMLAYPGGLELIRDKWTHMAAYYAMIVPQGRGKVRVLPGCRDPWVTFSLSRRDLEWLAFALKHLCRLLFYAGARRLYPTVKGLGVLRSVEDTERIPARLPAGGTELMTIHLTSTCAMHQDPRLGVTDPWGKVQGAENLRVVDAGLLCTAPGVNPQGPLLALVRRNIRHWLEQERG
jgi:choline dehydrogenase-like flavoprotein